MAFTSESRGRGSASSPRDVSVRSERRRPKAVLLAAALVLATAGCEYDEPLPYDDISATQASLSLDYQPVMVTAGTCRSRGFRPINDQSECTAAALTLMEGYRSLPAEVVATNTSPGCSIEAAALGGVLEGQALLRPSFVPGSETEIERQKCSHDAPCVCADELDGPYDQDDEPAPTASVCRDGEFQPNPHKYYTIRSPNGRFMRGARGFGDRWILLTPIAGDASRPYTQPTHRPFTPFADGHEQSNANLHFRFVASDADEYTIINRATGRPVSSRAMDYSPLADAEGGIALAAFQSQGDRVTFSCRGAQVFMTFEDEDLSPLDSAGLMTDHRDLTEVTVPLVFLEPTSPGVMTRKTKCMKKSRSCTSVYNSDYKRIGRSLCGVFKQNHRLTCQKRVSAPLSMYLRQGWFIEEVQQYSHAVDFDPAPVTVDPLVSPSAMADSIATRGMFGAELFGSAVIDVTAWAGIAEASSPLWGALFAVGMHAALDHGLGLVPQVDPLDELVNEINATLTKLQNDIEVRTNELIANGLARESTRSFWQHLRETTRQFYVDQSREKVNILSNTEISLPELDFLVNDLRTGIKANADGFASGFNGAFPTLSSDPIEDDVRRVHFAMDMAKLAVVHEVTMRAEAALLQAYTVEGFSCQEVIENSSLDTRATILRTKLENAVEELVEYGRSATDRRISWTADEFEFDARNFSYPIAAQLEFLDTIVEDTIVKCERLRDPEDPFREHFETNRPLAQP